MLKLTKKYGHAYLTFEMQMGETISSTQDVPIAIQSRRKVDECDEPALNAPKVKLKMPNLKQLSALCEKMKTLSDEVTITASNNGTMVFEAEAGTVRVKTTFTGLGVGKLNICCEV